MTHRKKEQNRITTFGMRIKLIRKALGMKQDEFSSRIKVSKTTLSDVETEKSRPGHDFFLNIREEFNVNLNYLLTGNGEMFGDESDNKVLRNLEKYLLNNPDNLDFFNYFQNSKIVYFQVMGYFRKLLVEEYDTIKVEMERSKSVKESS